MDLSTAHFHTHPYFRIEIDRHLHPPKRPPSLRENGRERSKKKKSRGTDGGSSLKKKTFIRQARGSRGPSSWWWWCPDGCRSAFPEPKHACVRRMPTVCVPRGVCPLDHSLVGLLNRRSIQAPPPIDFERMTQSYTHTHTLAQTRTHTGDSSRLRKWTRCWE
jgi:hypothetical protein